MKILLITDQHFGVRNDNQHFISHYKKFYGEIVVPFLKASKIKTIINFPKLTYDFTQEHSNN